MHDPLDKSIIKDPALLATVLKAFPSPVFIVDDDVSVIYYNTAARRVFGSPEERAVMTKGGEFIHCVNSILEEGGCGRATPCRKCVIRNSVGRAIKGEQTSREITTMSITSPEGVKQCSLMVTTAPISHQGRALSLLIVEDVSELIALRGLLPICAWCNRIRDDSNYWHSIEQYFKQHMDLDFTHGICGECAKKAFKEHEGSGENDHQH